MSTTTKPFDLVGFIMSYEGGEVSEEELIEGFQHLIDTGTVWGLQGSYGRMAALLIEQGTCTGEIPGRKVKPELIGTRCECGAPYDAERGGYSCAR